MKIPASLAICSLVGLAISLSAADAPAPSNAEGPASTPAASPTPAASGAPTYPADIPTPLTSGQIIELFPEGVPGWKDIGPEQIQGGTYTNISNPRMIVGLPPTGVPQNGTAIIFCAGGGYVHVALGNGFNNWLNPLGVTTFNLIYRCKEFGAPGPQQDVTRAVRLIRAHAKEFGIDPNKIGVMGDSAGGHVAASAATLYDDPVCKTGNALDSVSARPDFAVLAFSVLTMEPPYAHSDSKNNLIGRDPTQEMIDHYSLEKHVTAQTPPTFIIHTQGDTTVREENDLMFYAALRKNNVPSELHLYSYGPHGSGVGAAYGDGTIWQKLCEEWMRYNNWLPQSPTQLMPQGLTITSNPRGGFGRGGRGRGGPPAGMNGAGAQAAPAANSSQAAAPAAPGN